MNRVIFYPVVPSGRKGLKSMKAHKKHPLSDRHFHRVICCPAAVQQKMTTIWALTWRPGDQTDSFLDKALRPRTSPVCLVQSSEIVEPGKKSRQRQREHIHYTGYKTQLNLSHGELVFGGETGNCFAYDFGMRPHPGATGRIIDVEKNPALVYTGLEMHKLRQRATDRSHQLPAVPRLPTCYLGFYETQLPEMEDTPALRRRVAHTMRKPIEAIDAMSIEELHPFLLAEWADCFQTPSHPDNDTGLHLISQQLCSQVTHALRDYLSFKELMGTELFNPVRRLLPPVHAGRKTTIPNPAEAVIRALGYDPAEMSMEVDDPNDIDEDGDPVIKKVGWGEELDEDGCMQLIKKMRTALGDVAGMFSDDDILNFVVDYRLPIIPPVVDSPLVEYGEATTLRLMRYHCGRYSDCCRDEDLLVAAEHPNRPLFAAGLIRVQAIYAPKRIGAYYTFTPDSLGLCNVQADFLSIRSWWRHARRGTAARRKNTRELVAAV